MSALGKQIRLSRLMPGGRAVLVPFDDALINGPVQGLRDTLQRVREVDAAGADGIMGYRGLLTACAGVGIRLPFVANLTAIVPASHAHRTPLRCQSSRRTCSTLAVDVAMRWICP